MEPPAQFSTPLCRAFRWTASVFFLAAVALCITTLMLGEWGLAVMFAVSSIIFGLNYTSVRHFTLTCERFNARRQEQA